MTDVGGRQAAGRAVMSRSAAIALAVTLASSAPAETAHCPLGQLYRVTLGECVGIRSPLARAFVHRRPALPRAIRLAAPPAALSDTALLATAAEIVVKPAMLGKSPSPAASAVPAADLAPSPAPHSRARPIRLSGHPWAFSSRPRRRSAPGGRYPPDRDRLSH
jgi:hypothetical protein